MSTSKTNFEQVPVAIVKQIIAEHPELMQQDGLVSEISGEDVELDYVKGGTPTLVDSASPGEDWRELAQRIQSESDPTKLIGLVQELLTKLDQKQQRKSPESKNAQPKDQPQLLFGRA